MIKSNGAFRPFATPTHSNGLGRTSLSLSPHSSSLLKDISNFTTPRRPPFSLTAQSPSTQFFTASKHTSSSFRRRPIKSAAAAKKLKAFQLEQSQSSRKAQIKKEQSLKSLAKSLSVWLNFLLQDPTSCGCHFSAADAAPATNGKRDGAAPGISVGVDSTWRTPKRQRKTWSAKESAAAEVPDSSFSNLRDSLKDVCSFDDLKQRMRVYLSLAACKEIFQQMNRVTKTIDEGRLNMKAHCPIVTDVGLKDKAARILMCYSPIWLRIGLYIIFGGDSLVLNGDIHSDLDVVFLRMVIDKLFFSHEGLAKAYAYNKMVEGVYRSGYYENLGNVILKRILLLVLVLDKAKCQSYLPLEYGIDGLDGGSPLLFKPESWIKSSSQLIHEFLSSDVMHGEGNLLTHLVILGYKLSHQQEPLVEYDFRVRDLFVDLQDGLKLCRAVQLLQHNSSILMKIVVPPDTSKKKLANCGLALQYVRQAGGSLLDQDGIMIVADDIVNGDKELTLSLLWNMFVHLQIPLLVDKTSLVGEISKIRGFGTDLINNANSSSLELLLNWIQDHLNFHKLLGCDCQSLNRRYLRVVRCLSNSESVQKPDALDVHDNEDAARKFKAIQAWWQDMAERNRTNKQAVSNLQSSRTTECSTNIRRENAARTIQLHFRGYVVRHKFLKMVNAVTLLQTVFRAWLKVRQESVCMILSTVQDCDSSCGDMVAAAITVQKFVRGLMARSRYIHQLDQKEKALKFSQEKVTFDLQTNAAIIIQIAWIKFICCRSTRKQHLFATKIQRNFRRWLMRKSFLDQIQAVIKIQSYFRMWRCVNAFQHFKIEFKAAVVIQSFLRGWFARKDDCVRRNHIVEIQRHCRGWLVKRDFLFQRDAVVKIQCVIRSLKCQKALNCQKDAALEIQRFIRGNLTRNQLLGSASKSRTVIPVSCISRPFGFCSFQLELFLFSVVKLQQWWKGLLLRKLMNKSAITIQSCARGWIAKRKATVYRHLVIQEEAALVIQRYIRGHLTRNRILVGGASNLSAVVPAGCISRPVGCRSFQLELYLLSVVKLQRWWKDLLLQKLMTKSAIVIQSCTRGWIARRKATVQRHRIIFIQSHWKGYLARKESKEQLMDLRLRMQKSARNVDDSKRLINRLLAALSELLNMKSLSNILHTCSTLDMATEHSQKCCEELVAAGAIDTLLRLIQTVSRSIPDQEVLKHALSTLRNLARYPHLLQVLIQSRGSVQIIVLELLRNKNEGYFVASELLKKICSTRIGVETIFKSPALLKRLHGLVEDLTRKGIYEKRNPRAPSPAIKENRERRLKEAAEILKLITSA
ncbi:Abnormal spindle microcephaly-associated protein-like [Spatholobus suberectus]|nr:Abnormal spindle microcephaly-associated protein-like [Spatholobus suberectus]